MFSGMRAMPPFAETLTQLLPLFAVSSLPFGPAMHAVYPKELSARTIAERCVAPVPGTYLPWLRGKPKGTVPRSPRRLEQTRQRWHAKASLDSPLRCAELTLSLGEGFRMTQPHGPTMSTSESLWMPHAAMLIVRHCA